MNRTKKITSLLALTLSCIAIMSAGIGLYIFYLKNLLQKDTTTYLQEVAKRSTQILNTQILGDIRSLQSTAAAITANTDGNFEKKEWTPFLQEATRQNTFKRMGFALPSGVAFLSDGLMIDVSHRDYFHQALAGKQKVSDRLPDAVDKADAIILAVPVIYQNQTKGVLFAAQEIEDYARLITSDSFDGAGYSLIVTKDAGKIAVSNPQKTDFFKNIFQSLPKSTSAPHTKMAKDMQNGRSGIVHFHHPQEGWVYVSYQPTAINDWYLLSVIPEKVATQKTQAVLWLCGILAVSAMLAVGLLLFFIYKQNLRTQEKLYKAAYIDPLTGGYTWARARQEIRLLCAQNSPRYAFIIFDIHKFKMANEILGYEKANEILRHIGKVLQEEIKPYEEFSRVQADVFQLLLSYSSKEALKYRLELLNEKIVTAAPYNKRQFQLILSFGVYLIQTCPQNINDLLVKAALARDTIKGKYNEIVAFYDEEFQQKIETEQQIESQMEKALTDKEISLQLRPICGFDGKMHAAEAHALWIPDGREEINEDFFREIFIKNGFISQLDMYMAEEVFAFLHKRQKEGKELFPIALSLSIDSLHTPQFFGVLRKLIQKYQISPRYIWLQAAPQKGQIDKAVVKLLADRLHKEKFVLILDKMGKGTTSLELLKILPVDMMKLEDDVVKGIENNLKAKSIVAALVEMAKSLKLKIIFSGVETPKQLSILQELKADFYTGSLCQKYNFED